MKLTNKQISALAITLYDELRECERVKREAYENSKAFKDQLAKECKRYESAVKLVESGLVESFIIKGYWTEIKSFNDLERLIKGRLQDKMKTKTLTYLEIETKLHVLSIDSTNLESLTKAFKQSIK